MTEKQKINLTQKNQMKNFAVTLYWVRPDGLGIKALYMVKTINNSLAQKWAIHYLRKDYEDTFTIHNEAIKKVHISPINSNHKLAELIWDYQK